MNGRWRDALVALPFGRSLRSMRYLSAVWLDTLRSSDHAIAQDAGGVYETTDDPWNYDSPAGRRYLATAESFISFAAKTGRVASACEIGCGEGHVAAILCEHIPRVTASDLSSTALARAATRCSAKGAVEFVQRNAFDGIDGQFDLLVLTGVLDYYHRRSRLRSIQHRLMQAIRPRGFLLVATFLQNDVVESAAWTRFLVAGARGLHRFLTEDERLVTIRVERTDQHLFTLYQVR